MSQPSSVRSGKRVAIRLLAVILAVGVIGFSGVVGYYTGIHRANQLDPNAPLSVLNASSTSSGDGEKIDFSLFWKSWNLINKKFYGSIDDSKRLDGAIAGMVQSMGDPYTVYMEPSASQQFKSDLEGVFDGIGAELTVRNSLLTVVSPLEASPAEKAGIKGGDVIVEIDGKKAADMSFGDAIDAIRGQKGTPVTLTIARADTEKPFPVTVSRDTIVVKSVKTSSVGVDNSVAYIKVNQFGDDTTELFKAALQDAKNTGKKGIIVDLRNNGGGYLNAAVDMIGMLIPSKPESSEANLQKRVAVVEKFKGDTQETHAAKTDPILDTLPMAIIVNGGSASASEIFSGALKDYGRATLVGTKTFGKGSVQELQELPNGGSIKVTIAKWFTPLGTGIDGTGIEPDLAVELPEGQEMNTSDIQVSKALEAISK